MSGDEPTLESKIEGQLNLKKDSNLEDIRWRNFILNSEDSMLERKDEWEDETASISLIVEGKKCDNFSWDEGCKFAKLLLGAKESNEE